MIVPIEHTYKKTNLQLQHNLPTNIVKSQYYNFVLYLYAPSINLNMLLYVFNV